MFTKETSSLSYGYNTGYLLYRIRAEIGALEQEVVGGLDGAVDIDIGSVLSGRS